MHRFTIDLDGPLHGIDYGGEGRTVLLVHGLSGSSVNWVSIADGLTAYGRVLAPELPGFGRTPPAGRGATVEEQASLLAKFITRESGAPATVIGNSMGAISAMILAGRNPELVDRLVLIDTPAPSPSLAGLAPIWVTVMILYLVPGLNKTLLRWLHSQGTAEQRTNVGIDMIATRPERISPSTRQLHSRVTAERNAMPWMLGVHLEGYRSVIRNLFPYSRFDRTVRRVKAPTLLIHGTEDMVVPLSAAERLASLRPDWTYRPMVGVGHIPMMEAPELCLQLLAEFMQHTDDLVPPSTRVPTSPAPINRIDAVSPKPENVGAATY